MATTNSGEGIAEGEAGPAADSPGSQAAEATAVDNRIIAPVDWVSIAELGRASLAK